MTKLIAARVGKWVVHADLSADSLLYPVGRYGLPGSAVDAGAGLIAANSRSECGEAPLLFDLPPLPFIRLQELDDMPRDRQAEYVERMKAAGFTRVTVWCAPDAVEGIKALAEASRLVEPGLPFDEPSSEK